MQILQNAADLIIQHLCLAISLVWELRKFFWHYFLQILLLKLCLTYFILFAV